MTETTEIHTLAGAYALDALTEIERAAFARHVAECAACATEVAELTETAARLGAVTAQTPPASLRAAVLAEIARTRQVSVTRPAKPAGDAAQRWRRRAVAAVAAAVVALAGIGTVWGVEQNRLDQAHSQTAALQAQQNEVSAVLGAGDVQVHTSTLAGGGRLIVAVSASRNDGVVVMSGMPIPPAGKAYQLWLIRGSTSTSAGVMTAGANSGTAVLTAVSGADQLGVTLEPAGGSATPTLPTLVGVPL